MDFGKWGIQYLRYEYCNSSGDKRKVDSVKVMKDTFSQFNYDVCFTVQAMDQKGLDPKFADYWTISEKTFDSFTSVEYNFKKHFEDAGRQSDLGLLQVGNGKMSFEEEQTQFALWAISQSPLIISADLSTIKESSLSILKNEDILAVANGAVGPLVCSKNCDILSRTMRYPQVYTTTMADQDVVALVVNWSDKPSEEFWYDFSDIGLKKWDEELMNIRDLTAQKEIGNFKENQTQESSLLINTLAGHGSKMYRFNLVSKEQIEMYQS